MKPIFNPGPVVMTRGVADWTQHSDALHNAVVTCLDRHLSGDWAAGMIRAERKVRREAARQQRIANRFHDAMENAL